MKTEISRNETEIRLKKQLQELINEANSIPMNSHDIILFRMIDALRYCMTFLGYMSEEERVSLPKRVKGYKWYLDIISTSDDKLFKELVSHNSIILGKYMQLLPFYENVSKIYGETHIGASNLKDAVLLFFRKIGCFELYNKLKNAGMIIIDDPNDDHAWCINNYDLSYILMPNLPKNNFHYYTDFVHEMGHAYVDYILKDTEQVWDNSYPIWSEIFSYMFERMFHQFLYDNSLLDKDELTKIIAYFEASCINSLRIAIGTSQIIQSNMYSIAEDRRHIVPTADWLNSGKSESIFSSIENLDDYSEWISILRFHYTIGNMGSIKLLMDYRRDNEAFISRLPEIIVNISEMSLEELIEKICCVSEFENFFKNTAYFDYGISSNEHY